MKINVLEIQRLELRPKEILVVRIESHIPPAAKERFADRLKQMFRAAGYEIVPQILILDGGITLETIEKSPKKKRKNESR